MILRGKKPSCYEDYFNIRTQLLSYELSLGYRQREDMVAHLTVLDCIQDNLQAGLIDLALDWMVKLLSDNKTTSSIDGFFLEHMTSQEFKYTQKQELHEFPHAPEKRGFFSKRKKE